MRIDDIINTPWEELSTWNTAQIARATSTLSLAANKRRDRLLKHEKAQDIAITGLYDRGKRVERFGAGRKKKTETKGAYRNRALKELKRARKYLTRRDTTYTAAHDLLRDTGNYFGLDSDKTDEELFNLTQRGFHVFNKMMELDPAFINDYYKYENVLSDIGNYIVENPDISEDDLLEKMQDKLDSAYENLQEEQYEGDFFDDVLDMSDDDLINAFKR